ncbi:hypothetical protein AD948_08065 [Acetobacter senegalensis]|uniref:Uncharacterized protein n=1 Tax=Acetobacter senegalensis TaxID=446692 RepID=A0A149U2R1_9PROT|nr:MULTISPECIES: hypothetical protein [Acetobacter]KXV59660.1 hypothetical protein AD948_08065 [Acetobacter senegalensis]MCG0998810.1 hypothetical protein [Acetobacter persici]
MTADYRFDPLQFPMPVRTGLFPRRDIDLYAELSARVGVCVHGFMLADLGRKAWDLRKKYWQPGEGAWVAFREAVHQCHPHLPVEEKLAQDGHQFDSLYELAVYRSIKPILPSSVKLDVHPVVKGCIFEEEAFADFKVSSACTGKSCFIEVVGLFDRTFTAYSPTQKARKDETLRRLHRYPSSQRPILIFKDMVCDPEQVTAAIRQAIVAVAEDGLRTAA